MSARDITALALAFATLAAGCTSPAADDAERALEATSVGSVQGSIVIGDAFVVEDARILVAAINQAAEGTPGRAVLLADPPFVARTALQRDHWVLEVTLAERAAGAGAGEHRVRLDWNGELAGIVHVEGTNATSPQRVVVRYDLGTSLERSNVYAFEITRAP